MKKGLKLFPVLGLFFIFGVPYCWAQHAKVPVMAVYENIFDAGEVMEGSIIEHSFKLLNEGDGLLKITKVRTG